MHTTSGHMANAWPMDGQPLAKRRTLAGNHGHDARSMVPRWQPWPGPSMGQATTGITRPHLAGTEQARFSLLRWTLPRASLMRSVQPVGPSDHESLEINSESILGGSKSHF